ncbi:flagellar hook-length control protein FliK [Tissierella sp.]|uniref:flagellar hook-length control protein FliK n=1 Tax=Tissierella sp. TaxID=41274 RepID=UPI0028591CED|nr:flagellar hook-length control protein FliK [Tissierella sp.]MDR7856268.1 flagellar hook-length control protein FliK [Tissierella sp.]
MEVKIIDFKHSVKPSTNNLSKAESPIKSKDFSSTIESVNSKNSVINENNRTSKYNDTKNSGNLSNIDSKGKKIDDINGDELELDETHENEEVLLDDAMLLLSNLIVVKDIPVESEELELSLEVDTDLSLKTHISVENEELEHKTESIDNLNAEKEISEEAILKSLDEENISKLEEKPDNNLRLNIDNKNVELTSKKEVETSGIVNLFNKVDSSSTEEVATEEVDFSSNLSNKIDINDMENLNQQNSSKDSSENQEDPLVATQGGDDIELQDKPFVFIEKNGLKFVEGKMNQQEETVAVNRDNLIEQIVDKVKINFSDLKNEIKISLKPEALGELTMNIEVIKGEVIAKVMVDNQRTKEAIETNLFQLKEGIKDTGLEIKTFEVFVGSGSDFDKHNSGQFKFNQNAKKIKIKSQDNKKIADYEDYSIEGRSKVIDSYSENSLNLFA